MTRISVNTHDYDGKLNNDIATLTSLLQSATTIPKDIKLNAFLVLKQDLMPRPSFTGDSRLNLDIMIQDYGQFGRARYGPNYDPLNDLFIDDLLWICYEFVHQKLPDDDTKDIVIATLSDISHGSCTQGRSTRLIQILNAFNESAT